MWKKVLGILLIGMLVFAGSAMANGWEKEGGVIRGTGALTLYPLAAAGEISGGQYHFYGPGFAKVCSIGGSFATSYKSLYVWEDAGVMMYQETAAAGSANLTMATLYGGWCHRHVDIFGVGIAAHKTQDTAGVALFGYSGSVNNGHVMGAGLAYTSGSTYTTVTPGFVQQGSYSTSLAISGASASSGGFQIDGPR